MGRPLRRTQAKMAVDSQSVPVGSCNTGSHKMENKKLIKEIRDGFSDNIF